MGQDKGKIRMEEKEEGRMKLQGAGTQANFTVGRGGGTGLHMGSECRRGQSKKETTPGAHGW